MVEDVRKDVFSYIIIFSCYLGVQGRCNPHISKIAPRLLQISGSTLSDPPMLYPPLCPLTEGLEVDTAVPPVVGHVHTGEGCQAEGMDHTHAHPAQGQQQQQHHLLEPTDTVWWGHYDGH